MMKLNVAFIIGEGVVAEDSVTLDAAASVADLYSTIHAQAADTRGLEDDAKLTLWLAKTCTDPSSLYSWSWLQQNKLPLLDSVLIERGCLLLDDRSQSLACEALFGGAAQANVTDIHVVAVVKEAHPHKKRARVGHNGRRSYTNPRSIMESYCVPLDTTDAFRDIQVALTLCGPSPVVLLHGAALSGKTTIAHAIMSWIESSTRHGARCVAATLWRADLVDEPTMWGTLSCDFDAHDDAPCVDKASFLCALSKLTETWYFVVDNLEHLVAPAASSLLPAFVDALRAMKEMPHFGGFLGVCSGNIESLVSAHRDLFSEETVVSMAPFTEQQMLDLFARMKPRCRLKDSLTRELMQCSGGSPAVLARLVEFTITTVLPSTDGPTWKQWFDEEGFALLVASDRVLFRLLCDEWLELTKMDWGLLVGAVALRQDASKPVHFTLPPFTGDIEEVERRIAQLDIDASDVGVGIGVGNGSHAAHEDRHTRIYRQIRLLYLNIIAEGLRRPAPPMPTVFTMQLIVTGNPPRGWPS